MTGDPPCSLSCSTCTSLTSASSCSSCASHFVPKRWVIQSLLTFVFGCAVGVALVVGPFYTAKGVDHHIPSFPPWGPRACIGYADKMPISFDAKSYATCTAAKFFRSDAGGWKGRSASAALASHAGGFSRSNPNISSLWTSQPNAMSAVFAQRMRELLAPADPSPYASIARLLCDPFVDAVPRVAFLMTGNARSLLDPIVHQTIRRNAIEAFGGYATLFLDITLQDADSKFWTDEGSSVKTIDVPFNERKLHAVLRQFHNSGIVVGGVRVRTASNEVAAKITQAHDRRMASADAALPSYPLETLVTDDKPDLNDKCTFSDKSWMREPQYAARFVSQFSKIRDCYKMALAYEEARGLRFDWMVRLRPDVAFFDPIEPFCRYEKDTLHTGHGIDDFFFASRSVSDKSFLLIDSLYYKCDGVIDDYDPELTLIRSSLSANVQVYCHQSLTTSIIRASGGCALNYLREPDVYHTCAAATPVKDTGAALVQGVEDFDL